MNFGSPNIYEQIAIPSYICYLKLLVGQYFALASVLLHLIFILF